MILRNHFDKIHSILNISAPPGWKSKRELFRLTRSLLYFACCPSLPCYASKRMSHRCQTFCILQQCIQKQWVTNLPCLHWYTEPMPPPRCGKCCAPPLDFQCLVCPVRILGCSDSPASKHFCTWIMFFVNHASDSCWLRRENLVTHLFFINHFPPVDSGNLLRSWDVVNAIVLIAKLPHTHAELLHTVPLKRKTSFEFHIHTDLDVLNVFISNWWIFWINVSEDSQRYSLFLDHLSLRVS